MSPRSVSRWKMRWWTAGTPLLPFPATRQPLHGLNTVHLIWPCSTWSCTTVELARMLRERGVPTLFLSGHHRTLPRDMEDVIWIEKPVSFEHLIGALDGLRDQMTRSQT